MDLSALVNFFSQGIALLLPPVDFITNLVARIFFGLFQTYGQDIGRFAEGLIQSGVKLSKPLLDALLSKTKEGVDALAGWLKNNANELEVNEAAAQMIVKHAQAVAKAFDEAHLSADGRETAAGKAGGGLEALGGAARKISKSFQRALLKPDDREKLAAQMETELNAWLEQTVTARKNSLVEDIAQIIQGNAKGTRVKQTVTAADGAKVRRVSQGVILGTEEDPKPVKPGGKKNAHKPKTHAKS